MGKLQVRLVIVGDGLWVDASQKFPAGTLFGGGYDPSTQTLYLGMSGHPRGMASAGGNPSDPKAAGITMFIRQDGKLFWANDSQSLLGKLTLDERFAVQVALADKYNCPIQYLDRIEEIAQFP